MGKHACNTQEGNVGDMRMYNLQILLQYSTVSFKTSHVGRECYPDPPACPLRSIAHS